MERIHIGEEEVNDNWLHSMRDDIQKGGVGSGIKGHTTFREMKHTVEQSRNYKDVLIRNINTDGGNLEVWERPEEVSIVGIRVDESKRRKGIGSDLVDELIKTYKAKKIIAQTSNINSINMFYKKGFRLDNLSLNETLDRFKESAGSIRMVKNPLTPIRDLKEGSTYSMDLETAWKMRAKYAYPSNMSQKRTDEAMKRIKTGMKEGRFDPIPATKEELSGGILSEGKHRLIIARKLGIKEIPIEVLPSIKKGGVGSGIKGHKTVKSIVGNEAVANMLKTDEGTELLRLLNAYGKITHGIASDVTVAIAAEFIKNRLKHVTNFYAEAVDTSKENFNRSKKSFEADGSNRAKEDMESFRKEVEEHKKITSKLSIVKKLFDKPENRRNQIIAIDAFMSTAHTGGISVINRLWANKAPIKQSIVSSAYRYIEELSKMARAEL